MTTRVDGINITDGVITEAKLQTKLNPDNAIDSNAFNIGVLGFKLVCNFASVITPSVILIPSTLVVITYPHCNETPCILFSAV